MNAQKMHCHQKAVHSNNEAYFKLNLIFKLQHTERVKGNIYQ